MHYLYSMLTPWVVFPTEIFITILPAHEYYIFEEGREEWRKEGEGGRGEGMRREKS